MYFLPTSISPRCCTLAKCCGVTICIICSVHVRTHEIDVVPSDAFPATMRRVTSTAWALCCGREDCCQSKLFRLCKQIHHLAHCERCRTGREHFHVKTNPVATQTSLMLARNCEHRQRRHRHKMLPLHQDSTHCLGTSL